MPWTATFLTVAPVAGALADRIGERPLMVTGLSLQAIGMAWLALIAEPGMAYSQMLVPFVVAGVGVSMAIPAAQNSVLGSVAMDAIGKAAGRQQHDARARRGVRDRARGRRLRRGRELRLAASRSRTASRRRSSSPRACRSPGSSPALGLPGPATGAAAPATVRPVPAFEDAS